MYDRVNLVYHKYAGKAKEYPIVLPTTLQHILMWTQMRIMTYLQKRVLKLEKEK